MAGLRACRMSDTAALGARHVRGNSWLSLEVATEHARMRGGECWYESYASSKALMQWRCNQGHVWSATLQSVRIQGTWCRLCSRRKLRKWDLSVAQALAVSRGGVLLSTECFGASDPLRWRCQLGHEWSASFQGVRYSGSWCPTCATDRQRIQLPVVQSIAAAHSGRLLSTTYKNNRSPLRWECDKGHQWVTSLSSVKDSRTWCPECSASKRQKHLRSVLFAQFLLYSHWAHFGTAAVSWCR